MTLSQLIRACEEAHRFLRKAEEWRERVEAEPYYLMGCKEGAALRRSSLDLTRSLADLRRLDTVPFPGVKA